MSPTKPPSGSQAAPPADVPPRPAGLDPTADRMLAAARQGSNRAWAALVQRVDPPCRRLAHVVLGGHDVDATLITGYVRAYRARHQGDDDAVVVLTHHIWIACGHELRRRRRREDPAPGRRAVREDRAARFGSSPLGTALAALRPEERAVWALIDEEGFPVTDVSAALGVDTKVVTTVAARVARHLDRALESDDTVVDLTDGRDQDEPGVDEPDADLDGGDAVAGEPAVDGAEPDGGEPDGSEPDDSDAAVDDPESREIDEAEPDGGEGGEPDPDEGTVEPAAPTKAFWNELGRRLRAERSAPRAAPPPRLPEEGGPSPSLTAAKPPPVAMQKRAPARSRRERPDVVEELADEVDRQRGPRDWPRLALRGAAVVAAIVLLAAGLFALYRAAAGSRSPVRGDSVADVAARSMEVLSESGTWSASIEREAVTEQGGIETSSLTLIAAVDGSFRLEDTSVGLVTTYDALPAGTLQVTLGGAPARNELGAPLGDPDPLDDPDGAFPRDGTPLDDLATAARSLTLVDDEVPEEDDIRGEPVLWLRTETDDGVEVAYAVDADELTPVRLIWSVDGTTVRELRFSDVALDVGDSSFTQSLPTDAPPAEDRGFARVLITEVANRTELTPLTPDYLPDGFGPAGVAVHEDPRIAVLRYARGPQEILVTVRPSPVEAGQTWDDPFRRGEDEVTPVELALDEGPFRGTTALQVSGGMALPSVWWADGELAVTVSGDLTTEELGRVARSLRSR